MNKTTAILIGLVIVGILGVGGYALTKDDDTQDNVAIDTTATNQVTTKDSQEPNNNEPSQVATEATEAGITIDLSLKNFAFSQDTINAKPGETVTVNLSVENGSHNFTLDELNVQSKTISGNDIDTVTFTIPEDAAGQTYAYYCSIGSHRSQGMEGQLVISAN